MAQIRVVFSLQRAHTDAIQRGNPNAEIPKHLAYVHWFTPFEAQPDPDHKMYSVARSFVNRLPEASIIAVNDIRRSVHLIPQFPLEGVPPEWKSHNTLDKATDFFVNCFLDRHTYMTVF